MIRNFNRLFGFDLAGARSTTSKISSQQIYQRRTTSILEDTVRGRLLHADETRANIKGKTGFVWVFANMDEVAYVLHRDREGDSASDDADRISRASWCPISTPPTMQSVPSAEVLDPPHPRPERRCLEATLRRATEAARTAFAVLLKPMVETVDRHGLKSRFLRKHLAAWIDSIGISTEPTTRANS